METQKFKQIMKTGIKRLGLPSPNLEEFSLWNPNDKDLSDSLRLEDPHKQFVDDLMVYQKFGKIYAGESFQCILTVYNLNDKYSITDIDI